MSVTVNYVTNTFINLTKKRAEEIIDLVDKTHSEFNAPDEIISGDIYIGGGETDSMRLIAKIAHDLQSNYPNIRYHLFSGNGDDVTDKLDKGLIDFGIVIEPFDITKYDFIRIPQKDTWGLLMQKESHLASKDFIQPSDLYDIPIITSSQSLVETELSKWIGKDINELNVVATYNLVYNASLLVDEGMGYALCLDKLINTTGTTNLCFKPLSPPLQASLNIIWKKYQVFSRASEVFLKSLQEKLK